MKGSSDLILICCGTGISIEFKPMLLIGGTVLEYIRATGSPQALSLRSGTVQVLLECPSEPKNLKFASATILVRIRIGC